MITSVWRNSVYCLVAFLLVLGFFIVFVLFWILSGELYFRLILWNPVYDFCPSFMRWQLLWTCFRSSIKAQKVGLDGIEMHHCPLKVLTVQFGQLMFCSIWSMFGNAWLSGFADLVWSPKLSFLNMQHLKSK